MELNKQHVWLSIHLYYDFNPEILISKIYREIISVLNDKKVIRNHFFIRYNDELGPHIRLRVQIDSNCLPLAVSIINQQSTRIGHYSRYVAYEPETERYGGTLGLALAELFFKISTDVVFQLLDSLPEVNYQNNLLFSVLKNYAFLKAIKLDKIEKITMLNACYFSWLPYAKKSHRFKNNDEFNSMMNRLTDNSLEKISLIFDNQGSIFKKFPFLDTYFKSVKKLDMEFKKLEESGLLQPEGAFNFNNTSNSKRMLLYCSILHMNNNRMGIKNADESQMFKTLTLLYEAK